MCIVDGDSMNWRSESGAWFFTDPYLTSLILHIDRAYLQRIRVSTLVFIVVLEPFALRHAIDRDFDSKWLLTDFFGVSPRDL